MRRTLKWGGITLLILLAVAAAGSFAGKKTFRVETVIKAPPAAVWAVLMDTKSYEKWNPVFVRVDGIYAEGKAIQNLVKTPAGKTLKIKGTVKSLIPNRLLRQSGGTPGLLTYDHRWTLIPVPGGTKVVQYEVDRGLFLWFWDASWIQPAYRRVNAALRRRVIELGQRD